jgi:DNA-binding NtrC family response regulator
MSKPTLENKRVLIVDDEPDVLESLEELLDMCTTARAQTFEQAKKLLETEKFDIAILDIMGVDGYQLLGIAKKKNILTVMLTANALSPEFIKKSYLGGASSYIPKEEMINIEDFLLDVLKDREEGKNPWVAWYKRLEFYLKEKFGSDWDKDDKNFWNKKDHS